MGVGGLPKQQIFRPLSLCRFFFELFGSLELRLNLVLPAGLYLNAAIKMNRNQKEVDEGFLLSGRAGAMLC